MRCEARHSMEVELLSVLKRCGHHRLGRTNTKAREWTTTTMQAIQVLSEHEGKERLEAASQKNFECKESW